MSSRISGSKFRWIIFCGIFASIAFLAYLDKGSNSVVIEADSDSIALEDLDTSDQKILIEIPRKIKQESQQTSVRESVSKTVKWLNLSMEKLGEKLNEISEKIDETEDNTLVEEEIKKAFREAFRGESDPIDRSSDIAEVMPDSKAFEKIADASDSKKGPDIDRPVLGEGVPGWISERVFETKRIAVPLESSMHETLQECRTELASRLTVDAKRIIDEHVLRKIPADEIAGLTPEYIRTNLIDPDFEFDNYQERPSGNFHQLWVRLEIGEEELKQIREWEREATTTVRVWMLGGFSLAFLGSFAGLSEVLKLLSNREQNRKRARAAA